MYYQRFRANSEALYRPNPLSSRDPAQFGTVRHACLCTPPSQLARRRDTGDVCRSRSFFLLLLLLIRDDPAADMRCSCNTLRARATPKRVSDAAARRERPGKFCGNNPRSCAQHIQCRQCVMLLVLIHDAPELARRMPCRQSRKNQARTSRLGHSEARTICVADPRHTYTDGYTCTCGIYT